MSVARHTAYNLVGAIVPLGVTLVTVPPYLHAIGLDRYGVLALVWVLAGYFAFFDFGIGRATSQKMASLGDSGTEARNRLFWTSVSISAAFAFASILLFWPVAYVFVTRISVPTSLRPELISSLPLIVAAVPLGILQSVLGGALEGRRAFGPANVIGVIGNVLTAFLPLFSAWAFGPQLVLLIAAVLLSRVITLVALSLACRSLVPVGKPERDNRESARALLAYGGWTTLTGIAGPLLVFIDRFAIGAWLGAAAVGFYVIGYNLIAQMQMIPSAFSRAIFPRLAELSEQESLGRSIDATRVMIALVTPMTIVAIFGTSPFLSIWISPEVSEVTGPIAAILLLGFWTNAIAYIAFTRLNAMGRPDLVAKVHLAELLPYFASLLGMISWLGLLGAAAAWSLRCTIDSLLLGGLAGTLSPLRRELLCGSILLGISVLGALILEDPIIYWALGVSLVMIAVVWSWQILPQHLQTTLLAFAKRTSRIEEAR